MITYKNLWLRVPDSIFVELNLENGHCFETENEFMSVVDYVLSNYKIVEIGEI